MILCLSLGIVADGPQVCQSGGHETEWRDRKEMRRCLIRRTQNRAEEEEIGEFQLTNGPGTAMKGLEDAAEVHSRSMAGGLPVKETHVNSEDSGTWWSAEGTREASGEDVAGIGHCWDKRGGSCLEGSKPDNGAAG